jgi:GTP cyclohydrolase IA
MESAISEILSAIGEDINRQGLRDTPLRARKAWRKLTSGYTQSLDDIVGDAIYDIDNSAMVIVKDIEFYSLCEHHLLPFYGSCHVAYIPNQKIIGLSKIPRIVDMFARRLQVQERLCHEIANAISQATGALGVAVSINSQHLCMMMRGVQKQSASMSSSCFLGNFKENYQLRAEFLQQC